MSAMDFAMARVEYREKQDSGKAIDRLAVAAIAKVAPHSAAISS